MELEPSSSPKNHSPVRVAWLWFIDLVSRFGQLIWSVLVPGLILAISWLRKSYKISVPRLILASLILGVHLLWTGVFSYALGETTMQIVQEAGYSLAVKLVGYPILFVLLVVIFYLPPTYVTAKIMRRLKPVSRKPAVWRRFIA